MYDQLKLVLDHVVDYSEVNKFGTEGFSALHVAVRGSRVDEAELLLACGASPNVKSSSSGKTPLEELERMMSQDIDQVHLLYEVFEFDTLAKNFPDELLTLFTINKDESSNPPLSMAIPGLQKGSVFSSESFWLGLGQSDEVTWIHVNSTNVRCHSTSITIKP
jgi:ankyrin repeat protein